MKFRRGQGFALITFLDFFTSRFRAVCEPTTHTYCIGRLNIPYSEENTNVHPDLAGIWEIYINKRGDITVPDLLWEIYKAHT